MANPLRRAGKKPKRAYEMIGKRRAELYGAGKITLNDFVSQHGSGVPFEELRR